MGLIGAPELVADKCSKRSFAPADGIGARVMRFAEEEGPIVRAIGGDNIALCPPLTISEAEIEDLFARLARALNRIAR
jgi:4-aminobutyrate--pyruvate transaminase